MDRLIFSFAALEDLPLISQIINECYTCRTGLTDRSQMRRDFQRMSVENLQKIYNDPNWIIIKGEYRTDNGPEIFGSALLHYEGDGVALFYLLTIGEKYRSHNLSKLMIEIATVLCVNKYHPGIIYGLVDTKEKKLSEYYLRIGFRMLGTRKVEPSNPLYELVKEWYIFSIDFAPGQNIDRSYQRKVLQVGSKL